MSEPLHYVFNTPFFMTQVSFYAYTMISEKLALNPFLEPAPQFLMKTSISIEALSQSGAEKITFPPKPNGQTDIRTNGH